MSDLLRLRTQRERGLHNIRQHKAAKLLQCVRCEVDPALQRSDCEARRSELADRVDYATETELIGDEGAETLLRRTARRRQKLPAALSTNPAREALLCAEPTYLCDRLRGVLLRARC